MTATQDSLARLAAHLTDPRDRETYAALISYFRSLPPHDELFQLAQLLGFVSLLGQRIPEALNEFLLEFRTRSQATDRYCALVEARLACLPQEIASGVDLERIVQMMGESFRQQIATVGLEDSLILLRSSTRDVGALSAEISMALKLVAQEYQRVSAVVATELVKLTGASSQLREHNAKLIVQERWNGWLWQALLALLLFLLGGLCGLTFDKRQASDVHPSISTLMEQNRASEKQERPAVLTKRNTKRLE